MTIARSWPAHTHEPRPWKQTTRGGTIDDRKLSEITVALPPHIGALNYTANTDLAATIDYALLEIGALDVSHGQHLAALGTLLLRTESVASSKIEHVEADVADYARALYGIKANPSAVSMAAATDALNALINSVDRGRNITLEEIERAHHVLMADDLLERDYAGRLRDVQNWIGGSDHSPRNADYVPPPHDTVRPYLDDLITFANRTDISALVQAAIAHAQFESIHPFTDGNGRIGRALVNTILRRRGITHRIVIPLASALVARRDHYFDTLNAYRAGNPDPLIAAFAIAARIAAHEARTTADRIAEFPNAWKDMARPRARSAASKILPLLTEHPVFSADEIGALIGGAAPAALYNALNQLRDAGVLRSLTDRKRNQVWGAVGMLDELDDLGARIAASIKATALT